LALSMLATPACVRATVSSFAASSAIGLALSLCVRRAHHTWACASNNFQLR